MIRRTCAIGTIVAALAWTAPAFASNMTITRRFSRLSRRHTHQTVEVGFDASPGATPEAAEPE